mgnify:CR=1 FL=1
MENPNIHEISGFPGINPANDVLSFTINLDCIMFYTSITNELLQLQNNSHECDLWNIIYKYINGDTVSAPEWSVEANDHGIQVSEVQVHGSIINNIRTYIVYTVYRLAGLFVLHRNHK